MQTETGLQKVANKTDLLRINKSNSAVRIRDIEDPELIKMALKYVMTMLGLSKKQEPTKLEFDVLLAFVTENFGFISPEKIRLAFDFAISGKLQPMIGPDDLKLFDAPFSTLYVARIINAFLSYEQRLNSKIPLAPPKEPEPSEEEKDKIIKEGIIHCWGIYKSTPTKCIIPSSFYDYIQRRGIINYTQELRDKFKEQAKRELITEKNEEKANPFDGKGLSDYIKALDGQNSDVISRGKSIAVKYWFDSLAMVNETPEEKLNGEGELEF